MRNISRMIQMALNITGEEINLCVEPSKNPGLVSASLKGDTGEVITFASNWETYYQVDNCESVADAIAALDALCAEDLRGML